MDRFRCQSHSIRWLRRKRRRPFPRTPRLFEQLETRWALDGALAQELSPLDNSWFQELVPGPKLIPVAEVILHCDLMCELSGGNGSNSVLPPNDATTGVQSPSPGLLTAASGTSFRAVEPPDELAVTQWIVRLTDAATQLAGSPAGAARLIPETVIRGLGSPGLVLIETVGRTQQQVRAELQSNPSIRSFELDSVVQAQATPNDPLFAEQYNLQNTGQAGGVLDADIDAPEAWDVQRDASSVVVGVIDSGVDYSHPDLFQNIWMNEGEIPLVLRGVLNDVDRDGNLTIRDLNQPANASFVADGNGNGFIDAADILTDPRWTDGADTDNNGFIDDLLGWDFVQNDNTPFDEHRHGTHVTGILGASGDNGTGIAGVVWRSNILPLRFLDATNEGSTANAIAAFNYATLMRSRGAANIRVLNASWGGNVFSESLRETIQLAGDTGILTVAAAGNGDILGRGVDLESQPFYPASFDLDSVISVTAADTQDNLARFSNFGRPLRRPGRSGHRHLEYGARELLPTTQWHEHGDAARYCLGRPGLVALAHRDSGTSQTGDFGQRRSAAAIAKRRCHRRTAERRASVVVRPSGSDGDAGNSDECRVGWRHELHVRCHVRR